MLTLPALVNSKLYVNTMGDDEGVFATSIVVLQDPLLVRWSVPLFDNRGRTELDYKCYPLKPSWTIPSA